MHLLSFLKLYEPGYMMKGLVIAAQGVFYNAFFLAYLTSPRTCHRFVGYLEEEAVITVSPIYLIYTPSTNYCKVHKSYCRYRGG